jgi:hypothetical protein
MSFKYPKNVIVGVSVIAALLAGTVLLGGYASSQPADTEAPAKACQASDSGWAMTAKMASCPQMMAAQAESMGCTNTPCTEDCPKPCCAEISAEGCDKQCPKPCCADEGQKGCCAAKTAAQ